jgi:membrane-associated phospholipid phosphatase
VPAAPFTLTRSDLLFLGGAAAVTSVAMANDAWLTEQLEETNEKPGLSDLAVLVQPFGNPWVMYSATLGLWQVAARTGHPRLARGALHVGLSTIVAGVAAGGIKVTAGRSRPEDSPDDPYRFEPFSGNASFPSGHAAIAFAAATSLDRETTAGWIPWVAYPIASLVAWSRVHDLKHWSSDVVAGSAIGVWSAWKTGDYLAWREGRAGASGRTTLRVVPSGGGIALVAVRRLN